MDHDHPPAPAPRRRTCGLCAQQGHDRRHCRATDLYRAAHPEVTEADLAAHNIVVWGTPASNSMLAKMGDRLPVKWVGEQVTVGKASYPAGTHYPAFIYPNPLNPKRYVVVNSGFTFREFDYLNNARQISKLPDWAVIDTATPADGKYPGKVVAAGFFDEEWGLKR